MGWLKYKFGEPPVLASQVDLERNELVLQSDLENQGFFKAQASGDTVIKNKKAVAHYTITPGNQYSIDSVIFETDSSSPIKKAVAATAPGSLLHPKKAYNFDIIKLERQRIDAALKEEGYYFFNPDFLIIWADSSIGNHQVNLYVKVKPGIPVMGTRPYTINDIYIYSNYALRGISADTATSHAYFYDGYYIVDRKRLYQPRMFDEAMQFNTGDLYNRTDHNQSLSRLINLGVFKFVKTRFEVTDDIDSAKLNTFYYLTPYPKKSLRFQINEKSKSDNLTGTELSVEWRNRNTFKGGELLSIRAYGGFDIQYSGHYKGYNDFRAGIENNLYFPRFIVPFFDIQTHGPFLPKTNIELGYDILNKEKLYTLNSFRLGLNYIWKENIHKEHKVSPVFINYIQPINISQTYLDSSLVDPVLKMATDKQFILGSSYNFNYNGLLAKQPATGFYFNGNLERSGNIAGLITGANAKAGKTYQIFNADFSQYIKAETEFRYYLKLGDNAVMANRLDLGFGYPYGNSLALPFVRQFYSGGNNSLRGFRSRSVGPGTVAPSPLASNSFQPDKSGDIKLEGNTELRSKLFSIVEGALFIDAGNIWLYNKDTLQPGGEFTKDFMKQLAVNAGAGIRLNVSILILRFDVAFPIRKPWLPDGQRWVLNQVNFGDPDWRKDNIIFNIAIGYPF